MPTPSQHAFSEKVSLITDGANPIGRAIAMQLALYGSYVIVGNAHDGDSQKDALEELQSLGTLAHSSDSDPSTVAGARQLVSEVADRYGRLDLLVNCTNFCAGADLQTIDEEGFDKTIDKNLKSAVFVSREAFELMKKRPKPAIVNVLSSADSEETKRDVVFSSVSEALKGFTKSMAANLPENFRVNAVSVGENAKPASKFDKLDNELFRTRTGVDPDDVARAVIYLLSSEAKALNGQILTVE